MEVQASAGASQCRCEPVEVRAGVEQQNGSASGVRSGGKMGAQVELQVGVQVEWLVEVQVEVRVGCESGVRGVQGESWVRSICAR